MIGLASGAISAPAFTSFRAIAARPDAVRLGLFVTLFALALLPVLTSPIPAMVDYVNHLARMYELAAQGTAQASRFYHVEWKFYPNLAMDLVVPMLARWTGVELATRLFLLASQILVVTGSIAIELRVKGRLANSGFVAVLYLFNMPFAWGFLNFEFALGIALWGIASWFAVRGRPWAARAAIHTLFVAVLFAAHLFALGLYGVTLALHEAWAARRSAHPIRCFLKEAALLGLPVLVLAATLAGSGGSVGGSTNAWLGQGKVIWPLLLLNGDSALLSVIGSLLVIGLIYWPARRGGLAFVSSGAWLAAGFAVLYVVLPGRMLDTAFADMRMLVGAVMILPAFVSVTTSSKLQARITAVVVSGLTLANVACVERVWSSYQPVYRDMIASFKRLNLDARVLVGDSGSAADPPLADLARYPLYHAPTLAAHYAGAFVPTLFTTAGKQPLLVAPGLERLSYSCGGPIPLATLLHVAQGGRYASAAPAFLRHWPNDFDYVYLLGEPPKDPAPDLLELVEGHASFALYRVRAPQNSRRLPTDRASP